jgi:hypothetical protein
MPPRAPSELGQSAFTTETASRTDAKSGSRGLLLPQLLIGLGVDFPFVGSVQLARLLHLRGARLRIPSVGFIRKVPTISVASPVSGSML